jgi:hypothetical protein
MKKLYFLFTAILVANVALADWDPFPLNQRSYYAFYYQPDTTIISFSMDTIVQRTGYQALFFNRKYYGHKHDTCYTSMVNTDGPLSPPGFNLNYEFDSLLLSGDTLFYTLHTGNPYYILLKPTIGQAWPFYNYTLTCSLETVMQFCGISDSVKLYSGIPGATIVLSKNHGFVTYPEFTSGTPTLRTLTGFSDQSGAYGFLQPTYLDFFPYQPGDILHWEFRQEPFGQSPILNFRRDSITAITTGPDTISYTYTSVYYDYDTVVFNTTPYPFYFQYLPNILESPTTWISFDRPQSNYQKALLVTKKYVRLSDGSLNYAYSDYGIQVNDSDCSIVTVIDYGQDYFFNSRLGLTEISSNIFYPISQKLTGAYIGGVLWGDTSLHVGVDEIALDNIGLYPNPASKYLIVKSKFNLDNAGYSVFDLTGRKIMQGKINSNYFNLEELIGGIYFLEIHKGEKSKSFKFVKY